MVKDHHLYKHSIEYFLEDAIEMLHFIPPPHLKKKVVEMDDEETVSLHACTLYIAGNFWGQNSRFVVFIFVVAACTAGKVASFVGKTMKITRYTVCIV